MRLTVLALDYDGTIAADGVLDPDVRRAIADARERGITVCIVTGRTLDDLPWQRCDPNTTMLIT